MILEMELTTKYFEIVRVDDNNKPAELKIFDFGLRAFEDPTKLFRNEKESEEFSSLPIIFPGQMGSADEISRLEEQGWERMP